MLGCGNIHLFFETCQDVFETRNFIQSDQSHHKYISVSFLKFKIYVKDRFFSRHLSGVLLTNGKKCENITLFFYFFLKFFLAAALGKGIVVFDRGEFVGQDGRGQVKIFGVEVREKVFDFGVVGIE